MRLHRNLKSRVFPHPVSPIIMTGILHLHVRMNSTLAITLLAISTIHLKRIIIAKILMTLSAVRTNEGSGSFTAQGSNPITAASFCSCSVLK